MFDLEKMQRTLPGIASDVLGGQPDGIANSVILDDTLGYGLPIAYLQGEYAEVYFYHEDCNTISFLRTIPLKMVPNPVDLDIVDDMLIVVGESLVFILDLVTGGVIRELTMGRALFGCISEENAANIALTTTSEGDGSVNGGSANYDTLDIIDAGTGELVYSPYLPEGMSTLGVTQVSGGGFAVEMSPDDMCSSRIVVPVYQNKQGVWKTLPMGIPKYGVVGSEPLFKSASMEILEASSLADTDCYAYCLTDDANVTWIWFCTEGGNAMPPTAVRRGEKWPVWLTHALGYDESGK